MGVANGTPEVARVVVLYAIMLRSDFYYDLPPDLIAQRPLEDRAGARMLVLDGSAPCPLDQLFVELPRLLRPGDLLVFNNTRVMRARLFGHKTTGGQVELLIERVLGGGDAIAHVRASKPPKPGSVIELAAGERLLVVTRAGGLFRLRALGACFADLMSLHGHIPLPPYIHRPDDVDDEARYQTLFATREGAVAAPTAGLHFDAPMLQCLADLGVDRAEVTLHVGAGTFQPVRVDDLDQHLMHAEWLEVSEETCERIRQTRASGGRVIAVGTTSVRSLETAAVSGELGPFSGETALFIRPGYRFRIVDAMITNFHLPESTLLMLVAAFAGYESIMSAYRHAVMQRYRFFSYGDAMFLARKTSR